jgi:hypothetical protein
MLLATFYQEPPDPPNERAQWGRAAARTPAVPRWCLDCTFLGMTRSSWPFVVVLTVLLPYAAAAQTAELPSDGPTPAVLESQNLWLESLHRSSLRPARADRAVELPPIPRQPPVALNLTPASGVGVLHRAPTRFAQGGSAPRNRTVGRRVLGAVVGGAGGFFAGGYLGAWIDGECDCDDPGFKGALIGAPVGAALGAIFGGLYLF